MPSLARPRRRPFALAGALVAVLSATACDPYAVADPSPQPAVAPSATPIAGEHLRTEPACAPPGLGGATTVVEAVRTEDGGCAPLRRAMVYRCDPAFDPVAVLDAGASPLRFLGGTYAVPVPAPPADAEPIGVTATGRLWTSASDPKTLVVESGGRFARWLALPLPDAVGDAPTSHLIGDSIMEGAEEALSERLLGWALTVDAEIGRGSYGGALAAEEAASSGPVDVAVVELGVNDHDTEAFASNAERIVAALRDADLFVWMTAHGPDPQVDHVNRAIVATVGPLPNGAVLDWDRLVPPEDVSSDGVHLADATGAVFADVLTSFLSTWHLAATGRGADGCGGEVRAAAT
jgi:hypothetical protein